jgi:hypothetical protein
MPAVSSVESPLERTPFQQRTQLCSCAWEYLRFLTGLPQYLRQPFVIICLADSRNYLASARSNGPPSSVLDGLWRAKNKRVLDQMPLTSRP